MSLTINASYTNQNIFKVGETKWHFFNECCFNNIPEKKANNYYRICDHQNYYQQNSFEFPLVSLFYTLEFRIINGIIIKIGIHFFRILITEIVLNTKIIINYFLKLSSLEEEISQIQSLFSLTKLMKTISLNGFLISYYRPILVSWECLLQCHNISQEIISVINPRQFSYRK